MKEDSHGEVFAYWQANMLIIKPSLGFNLQGIEAAKKQILRLINHKPTDRWVRVYVFEDCDSLAPMEAHRAIKASIKYGVEHGCFFACLVGGNLLNRETFSTMCSELNLPFHLFNEIKDAEQFILGLNES